MTHDSQMAFVQCVTLRAFACYTPCKADGGDERRRGGETFISQAASSTRLGRVRQPRALRPSSLSLAVLPAARAPSAPRPPVADLNRPLAPSRLLSPCCVSGTVLGAGDGVTRIPDLAPAPGQVGESDCSKRTYNWTFKTCSKV